MKIFKISCRNVIISISPRGESFKFSVQGERSTYLKKKQKKRKEKKIHSGVKFHTGVNFSSFAYNMPLTLKVLC